MIDTRDAQRLLKRAQTDPLWYLQETFGAMPWSKQRRIIESVRDNAITMVKSCHAIGKSWIAAHVALWFLYTHPNSIVFTTAPTFRQVEMILWREIAAAHGTAILPLGGPQPLTTRIDLGPKWYAFGLSTDKPTSFQGIHSDHVLGIIDEACGVEDEIWNAIKANLSSGNVRLLGIGNPTDKATQFARYFDRDDIGQISVSAFDTPNFTKFGITIQDYRDNTWKKKITGPLPAPFLINPQYVAEIFLEGEDSPEFMSRVLARFPAQNESRLIEPEWVLRAKKRWEKEKRGQLPRGLGLDVARYGNDASVAVLREGICAKTVKKWQGLDGVALGASAVALAETYPSVDGQRMPIALDTIGVGASPYDQINRMGYPCISLVGSEASDEPERFLNARAQWHWDIRQRFRDDNIAIPPWEKIMTDELEAISYKFDKKGLIQIEDKDAIKKKLGGRSPDHSDALVYAFAGTRGSSLIDMMRKGGVPT